MQKRLPVFTLLLGCLSALRPAAAQTGQQALDLIGYSSKSFEMRLKKLLLHNYDATSRPVINDKDNITALVGISLYHILDTVEKQQTITAVYSVRVQWYDQYLRWNQSQFGNMSSIWIPSKLIWRPDIVIINLAQDEFKDYMNTNVVVTSEGNVLWMFPISARTTCNIDVRYFPFDEQHCKISFISWTYSGNELDLRSNPKIENAIYFSSENQEWNVTQILVERREKKYACCGDTVYPDVTFTIIMKRRSLFHILNLVVPALLIYFVAVIGFFLPLKTEKVHMETTVLLTLVVFLLMVSEILPPTPDSVPVLSLMFLIILHMVSLAIVMAVFVTNFYYRPRFKPLPELGRRIIKLMFKEYYTLYHDQQTKRLTTTCGTESPCFHPVVPHDAEKSCPVEPRTPGWREPLDHNGLDVASPQDHFERHSLQMNSFFSNSNVKTLELNEWQVFAECLDRVFFIIFLLLSLILALIFIIQIVPMLTEHH